MTKTSAHRQLFEPTLEETVRNCADLAKDYISHCILEGRAITAAGLEIQILSNYYLDPKPRVLTPLEHVL
jgi:hypothetical protein